MGLSPLTAIAPSNPSVHSTGGHDSAPPSPTASITKSGTVTNTVLRQKSSDSIRNRILGESPSAGENGKGAISRPASVKSKSSADQPSPFLASTTPKDSPPDSLHSPGPALDNEDIAKPIAKPQPVYQKSSSTSLQAALLRGFSPTGDHWLAGSSSAGQHSGVESSLRTAGSSTTEPNPAALMRRPKPKHLGSSEQTSIATASNFTPSLNPREDLSKVADMLFEMARTTEPKSTQDAQVGFLLEQVRELPPEERNAAILASSGIPMRPIDQAMSKLPHGRRALVENRPYRNVLSNFLTSLKRDGSITTAWTFARELIGYGVQNWSALTPERRVALSYSMFAISLALNAASMARQHLNKTANNTTRVSQMINFALVGMTMILAEKRGVMSDIAPLLTKAMFYSIGRDSTNTFFPMGDILNPEDKPPAVKATLTNVMSYSLVSTAVNFLQSIPGVFSGTSDAAASMGLAKAMLRFIPFSAANGWGEATDGIELPYIQAMYQNLLPPANELGVKEPLRKRSQVVMETKWGVPDLETYLDKVTGLMNGRIAFFMVAYGILGVINKVPLGNAINSMVLANFLLGFITGGYCPPFAGGASTSPRPIKISAQDEQQGGGVRESDRSPV